MVITIKTGSITAIRIFSFMKKVIVTFFIVVLMLSAVSVFAEISQEEQQGAAQRAYEASADSYNSVSSTLNRAVATVTSYVNRREQVRTPSSGAASAVRG